MRTIAALRSHDVENYRVVLLDVVRSVSTPGSRVVAASEWFAFAWSQFLLDFRAENPEAVAAMGLIGGAQALVQSRRDKKRKAAAKGMATMADDDRKPFESKLWHGRSAQRRRAAEHEARVLRLGTVLRFT